MKTMSQFPRRHPFGVRPLVRSAFAVCLLAGLTAATTAPKPAAPSASDKSFADCQLDYQRADNMWAPLGVPSASLGTETIGLAVAQKKVFITDWKYEKIRNNGTSYYGSHLRIATNRSGRPMSLTIRAWEGDVFNFVLRTYPVSLPANSTLRFRADLVNVLCQ